MSATENSPQLQEQIKQAFENGTPFAKAFDIPKATMEGGYSLAYNNFKAGNYKDAEALFQVLTLFNLEDPRFTLGMGLCREKRNSYAEAADSFYLSAIMSDYKDPIPLYHAAVCFMKMGEKTAALNTLEKVEAIEEDEYTKDIKQTCRDLYKLLSEK